MRLHSLRRERQRKPSGSLRERWIMNRNRERVFHVLPGGRGVSAFELLQSFAESDNQLQLVRLPVSKSKTVHQINSRLAPHTGLKDVFGHKVEHDRKLEQIRLTLLKALDDPAAKAAKDGDATRAAE